jgi:cellobiose PTS system EIIC component
MNTNINTFNERLQIATGKFSNNIIIQSIANGMIKILPISIVGSIAAILSNLGIPAYQKFIDAHQITPVIKLGTTMTIGLISLYVIIALANEMASILKQNKANAIILSLMVFFLLTPLSVFEQGEKSFTTFDITYLGSKGMFVGMVVALATTRLYAFIIEKKWTIKMPDAIPPHISNSFTALIPAVVIGVAAILVNGLFTMTSYKNIHDFIYTVLQQPLSNLGASIWTLLFILFIGEVLWFFGIHGSLATSAILYTLYQPSEAANLAAYSAGDALPYIITMTFISVMKGPRHFALALLLLVYTKSKHLKSVGKIAIGPGVFGISEPMKFGIPMVLNPVLFVPMALAPVISTAIAYVATVLEIIPRANGVTFPWQIPFISGVIIGDWRTGLLQILQIVVIIALYIPFIKYLDKQTLKQEQSYVVEKEA